MARISSERILLVEDNALSARMMRKKLEAAGYAVDHADCYEEAVATLQVRDVHLAIVDVCLDANDADNTDGLKVVSALKAQGLGKIIRTVFITSFENEEWVREAFEEYEAIAFIRKDDLYMREVVKRLPRYFKERVGINFDLELVADTRQSLDQSADAIHSNEPDWLEHEILVRQMYDLLSKLFPRTQGLDIMPMTPGQSGLAILKVRPINRTTPAQWVIVKIGRRKKIAVEMKNYEEYVQDYLPTRHVTALRHAETPHLGGLVYTLANLSADAMGDLEHHYRAHTADEVIESLQQLFQETCEPWYRGRKPDGYKNLRDLYLEAFELENDPDRFAREIGSLRDGLNAETRELEFPQLGVRLPNPLRVLTKARVVEVPVSTCTTHGDLHTGNILVDEEGRCWLIDFYRTHPSHVLRDLVKLEVDIKLHLLDPLKPAEFFLFEKRLLKWDAVMYGGKKGSAKVDKALQVIRALRKEAKRLLDERYTDANHKREIQNEYFVALLMTTLNVLRLRHYKETPQLRPYRELALMSACLIAQRLQELNHID